MVLPGILGRRHTSISGIFLVRLHYSSDSWLLSRASLIHICFSVKILQMPEKKKPHPKTTTTTTDQTAYQNAHRVLKGITCICVNTTRSVVKEDSWHEANEKYVWLWQMISGTKMAYLSIRTQGGIATYFDIYRWPIMNVCVCVSF